MLVGTHERDEREVVDLERAGVAAAQHLHLRELAGDDPEDVPGARELAARGRFVDLPHRVEVAAACLADEDVDRSNCREVPRASARTAEDPTIAIALSSAASVAVRNGDLAARAVYEELLEIATASDFARGRTNAS